jgi:photosystem II stability/assembly factor-like uncharacterized protein
MRGMTHAMVGSLFLVVLAVTPALAEDASDDPNGSKWNDVCSLAVGSSHIRWAVGDSGQVLKMVNGETFVEYVLGKGQFDLLSVSFADADHGWIVGFKRDEPNRGRGVIFSTRRGGDHATDWIWSCPVVRPDVNVPFLKVQAMDIRHVWVTCRDGHLLWTKDGGARWAVTAKHDRPNAERSDHEK